MTDFVRTPTSLGLHMVIALATIMLVWFGVQEALPSCRVDLDLTSQSS